MAKNNLVQELDDIDFESEQNIDNLDEFDDVSEEELQEIEEIVDKKPSKKKEKKQKETKKKQKETKKKVTPEKKSKLEKETKKKVTPEPEKSKNKGIFYAIVFIVIIAIILAIGFNTNWLSNKDINNTNDNNVVAYVNGVAIEESYLNDKFNQISTTSLVPINKEDVLNDLIEQELIRQKAEELGITVTPEEAEMKLNEILVQQGMTKEQFEENIQSVGLTLDDVLDDMTQYIYIEKLSEETFKKDITTTNKEITDYFTDKVIVRHILLLSQEENDSKLESLEEIKEELEKDDSKFCDYVTELSEDSGSIESCGRYVFGKGQMVKEFEEMSFDLEPEEIGIVKTQYGYHLIQRLNIDKEAINNAEQAIIESKTNQAFNEFIQELKDNADIQIIEGQTGNIGFDLNEETTTTNEETTETTETNEETDFERPSIGAIDNEENTETTETNEENTEENTETTETNEENTEEELTKVELFYSESDSKSLKIYETINDLKNKGLIDLETYCVRINSEDKELCIELYGETAYNTAMTKAKTYGLKYAPSIVIEDLEYEGEYTQEAVEEFICNIVDC